MHMKLTKAILILSGMIIGVGMFGIPFSFAKAGFLIGTLELFILTGVVMLLHILYGEIIMATPSTHRLPGYVSLHLGSAWGKTAGLFSIFGIAGSLLAYIVIGAGFLQEIMRHIIPGSNTFIWALALTAGAGILALYPLKKEAKINGALTVVLLGLILFLSAKLFPYVNLDNLWVARAENFFIPYGVLIFALSGSAAIPDVVSLLQKKKKGIRTAIVAGTLLPGFLYFIFSLAVIGSVGKNVSPEAIQGLKLIFSEKIIILGSIIGFLAVATSFFTLSRYLKELLQLDFAIPKALAWASAIWVPFFFYMLGFDNFLAIIGIVGVVSGGAEATFLITVYHRIKSKELSPSLFSYGWKTALLVMFLGGVVYEIIYSL